MNTLFGEVEDPTPVAPEKKTPSALPWDYTNSIYNHKYIMDSPESEKAYNPYYANKHMSFFPATLFYANEMNMLSGASKKMQYDYYFNSVRKQKPTFVKNIKPQPKDDIEVVMEYYKYSVSRAEEALSLLSKEQIETIKKKMYKGGVK